MNETPKLTDDVIYEKPTIPMSVMWIILACGVITALLWFGVSKLASSPIFFATETSTVATTFPSSTPTKPPTRTPRPTLTSTPIPAWVTEYVGPVLAAIANQRPHFQDDFSQESVSWRFSGQDNGGIEIADGALITTIGTGGDPNSAHFCAYHPAMRFKNFALRVDVDLRKISEQDGLLIKWRGNDISDGLGFELVKDGRWWVYASKPYAELASGWQNIDPAQKLTITILSKDTQYAVYVGETLFVYIDDSGRQPGVGIQLCVFDYIGVPSEVKYDDIRVWDLDKLQGLP